ncbi:MAG: DNA primase [Armatimonadetes bacterium]|nr:DNA primase [Armatimonadota bacterium]
MGPEAAKEEIRERIDLVDLIGRYVDLKQAGRNWKGLCPFHQEKTPSFNVNRELKIWKCFGCGASGDVFSFVQRVENVGFVEAMKLLADRLGITWEPTPQQREARDEREQILNVNAVAVDWFRAQLRAPIGAAARAYLESRGLDEATIERFHIGYAPPGWDRLLNHLSSKGIAGERAVRAGLARRHEEQGSLYDVFRNRIIYPISDVIGRVIAFGGRAMDPDDPAKYLNSPETLVFRKGRTFYGLDIARRAIADEGFVVVVEGYMDVIALAQHGVNHCVATLGTALTEQHANILSRYAPEICLVFDADEAGTEAGLRSIRARATIFQGCPATVKVAALRGGKDPDDYIRQYGADAFRELLGERQGLAQYQVREVFRRHADQGEEGRGKAAREVADILAHVADYMGREALVAWAAEQWAGPAGGRAVVQFERLLLQELQRLARATAPAERDAWQRVLAKQGFPRAGSRRQGRRLARVEWLEQERRREQFLLDVEVARASGIPPDSEHSPVSADFIAETLAKGSHPVVRGALRCERRMLTAMLLEPGIAGQVLGQLAPAELLLPIHREIAQVIAELLGSTATPSFSAFAERLSENEELFASAVDIAVAEEEYDPGAIDRDVLLIREAQLLGDRGVRLYGVESEPLEPQEAGESLADIEQRVQELMRSEDFSPDDPAYRRLMEIRKRLHGRGAREYWDYH